MMNAEEMQERADQRRAEAQQSISVRDATAMPSTLDDHDHDHGHGHPLSPTESLQGFGNLAEGMKGDSKAALLAIEQYQEIMEQAGAVITLDQIAVQFQEKAAPIMETVEAIKRDQDKITAGLLLFREEVLALLGKLKPQEVAVQGTSED